MSAARWSWTISLSPFGRTCRIGGDDSPVDARLEVDGAAAPGAADELVAGALAHPARASRTRSALQARIMGATVLSFGVIGWPIEWSSNGNGRSVHGRGRIRGQKGDHLCHGLGAD